MTPDEEMRMAHLKDDVERLQRELAEQTDTVHMQKDLLVKLRAESERWMRTANEQIDSNIRLARREATARDRIATLEAVLAAARTVIRHPTDVDSSNWIEATVPRGQWDALANAVRDADVTTPTERTTIDADASNPRSQGQNL